jgi:hypothetical protein
MNEIIYFALAFIGVTVTISICAVIGTLAYKMCMWLKNIN